MSRAGYVLTGGRSSRMGTDKAMLAWRGGVLAQAVAREVALAAGRAVLVGCDARHSGLGYPLWRDTQQGEGPLAALVSILERTAAEWNLVVACDMPALTAAYAVTLFEAAEADAAHNADAVIPVDAESSLQPLCAVYHRRAAGPLGLALARGERSLRRALEQGGELRVFRLEAGQVPCFENVNTPEEWATHGR